MSGISNPDILISGGIWEVKTPTSFNEQTIKNRFREAVDQASRVIFDLRFVKKNANKVEKQVVRLYRGDRNVRHLILISKNGAVFDMAK